MAEETKRGPGRLKGDGSKYTDELALAVLDDLMEGKSLRFASSNAGVDPATVLRWCRDIEGFAQRYTSAREIGYLARADELDDICAGASSTGDVARDRLRFDQRRWELSKMLPKIYGDKLVTEHAGKVEHQVNGLNLEDVAKMLASRQAASKKE